MGILCILAAAALSTASPEEEVAAIYGEPCVTSVSYYDYISQGQNNFQMVMLTNIYLDSLETAVDSLYLVLSAEFSNSPGLLEALDSAHSTFQECSAAWASLVEEREWWNTEEGVRCDGTARGYTYASCLAELRWRRICSYHEMIVCGPGRDDSPGLRVEIGGYDPGSP